MLILRYLKSIITNYGKEVKLFIFNFLKQLSTKISAYDTGIIVENIKKVVDYDIATYYDKTEADKLIQVKAMNTFIDIYSYIQNKLYYLSFLVCFIVQRSYLNYKKVNLY